MLTVPKRRAFMHMPYFELKNLIPFPSINCPSISKRCELKPNRGKSNQLNLPLIGKRYVRRFITNFRKTEDLMQCQDVASLF